MSDELKEINNMLEEYILYLKTGAFKRFSVEEDIRLCENAIKDIDRMFSEIHSGRMKKFYKEYANMCRKSLLLSAEKDRGEVIKAISICEKVIEDPSYENCKELEHMLLIVCLDDEYDCVTSESDEREVLHRKMYYTLKSKLILLNNCF